MAVGFGVTSRGGAVRWNGRKWSHVMAVDTLDNFPTAVSCTSARFCLAADSAGNVLTWNGVVWSAPVSVGDS
jgi:hypothetical protein